MSLQLADLALAYAITAAAMLAGLLLLRADSRAYWRWPVYSAMAMALGVVIWNLLRKHVLPPDWVLTKPGAIFYGALVLYALVGFGLGLLLGKLTRVARGAAPPEDVTR